MYEDDAHGRMAPRVTNLADDAWVKVHSLPLTVRSLLNVQINEHHPDSANRGLGYSLKYALKGEPQTKVQVAHPSDDAVTHFLRGQFVSLASVAAFVLDDPPTECTRGATPCAFPSWAVRSPPYQRDWRFYTERIPYRGDEDVRKGYTEKIPPQSLLASMLMAPYPRHARYLVRMGGRLDAPESAQATTDLHPTKLSRITWDDVVDPPRAAEF